MAPPTAADSLTPARSVRDEWMKEDLAGWLAPNRLYPGAAEALARALAASPRVRVAIVTTKQARFTHALLRDLGAYIVAAWDCQ